jgi:hypothetical protein
MEHTPDVSVTGAGDAMRDSKTASDDWFGEPLSARPEKRTWLVAGVVAIAVTAVAVLGINALGGTAATVAARESDTRTGFGPGQNGAPGGALYGGPGSFRPGAPGGDGLMGQVTAVSATEITLALRDGSTTTVSISADTTVETPGAGAAESEIAVGDAVMVEGSDPATRIVDFGTDFVPPASQPDGGFRPPNGNQPGELQPPTGALTDHPAASMSPPPAAGGVEWARSAWGSAASGR